MYFEAPSLVVERANQMKATHAALLKTGRIAF